MQKLTAIVSLFSYLIGGLLWAFGLLELLDQGLSDRVTSILSFGGLALLLGAIAHLLRDRYDDNPQDALEASQRRQLLWPPLLVWAAAIVVAWVQFEAHADSVWMFPLVSILSAAVFAARLGKRLFGRLLLARILVAVTVAFVGIPLGVLGFDLPATHFRKHLTPVRIVLPASRYNVDEPRDVVMEVIEPEREEAPLTGMATNALIGALATAKPVSATELVESGKLRYRADGGMVLVDEDGVEAPILTGEAATKAVDAAFAEAAREDEAEREAVRRRNAEKREALRRGGRLFSGW